MSRPRWILVLGLLAVIGTIAFVAIESRTDFVAERMMRADQAQESTRQAPASGRITMAMYNQLDTGMTYDQARTILGNGEELSSGNIAGVVTAMYAWKNRDGSNMNAMFQDGKLITKAQFGLK